MVNNANVQKKSNQRKERVGIVLSDKMQKTIVVQIRRKARHPKFGKVIEIAKKFKAHDEKNQAKIGDTVRIVETRPISKDKCWRLVEVVAKGQVSIKDELKDSVSKPVSKKASSASVA